MSTLNQYIFFATLTLTIVSCGGGGDEATTPPLANEDVITPVEAIQTTDDLISNTSFEFTSGFELTLILSALEESEVQHFVNVCSDYTQDNQNYIINYDSCRLRAPFTETQQHFDISLSAAETTLIAQVWPIENNATPINFFWSRADNDEEWQINLTNNK